MLPKVATPGEAITEKFSDSNVQIFF